MAVKLYTKHLERRFQYFPDVTDDEWDNWHWQVKNRITNADDLNKYIELEEEELKIINNVLGEFRMAITPYYLTLINPDEVNDPVRLQAVPSIDEMHIGGIPEDRIHQMLEFGKETRYDPKIVDLYLSELAGNRI